MFENLAQKIQSLAGNSSAFDPSLFGDPIALQTGWTPAGGGGSFADKLVEVSSGRLEFRGSVKARLSFFVFLLIGVGVLIGVPAHKLSSGGLSFNKDTVVPMLIGLAFLFAGSFLLYLSTVPVVFDKQKGFFWKGRKAPDEVLDMKTLKYCVKLEDIHALQLIAEFVSGPKKSSYYRYEMNLVLGDGKRINVVVDGDKNKIREKAGSLSGFLNKPVWDAI